jgi:RNA polymerase sigma factor (sigma-70 family)
VDDETGYVEFVARTRPSLVHVARSLGRDDDAEDVVQTALSRLVRAWPRLAGEPFPRRYAYAKRAVVNAGRSYWRQYGSRVTLTRTGQPEPPPDQVPSDAGAVALDNLSLRSAFRALPARQQEILFLRYVANVGDQEIASRLGCSPVTVRTTSARGLHALQAALTAA